MKKLSKVLVLVLSAIMVLAMSVSVFADPQGQGTITVSNATKGQEYKAYKVFNAVYTDTSDPGKGVNYTVPSSLESQVTAPFSVSTAVASNGEKIVTVAEGTSEADILTWVKNNYNKFDSTGTVLTYSDVNGTATATLEYGYYYVTSTLGSVITIDSLDSAVTIVDKNESKPTGPVKIITKEVSSIDESLNKDSLTAENNDAAVGSVESFNVSFNATNWVQSEDQQTPSSATPDNNTKVRTWNFKDTPTGLNIDTSTVKVTVNGNAVYENGASVGTANVTVSGGGTSPLEITIPFTNDGGASIYPTLTPGSENIPVVVTYDAKVTADAATADATNAVDVKYNNDTSIGTDSTTTKTYKFILKKTDNNDDPLDGAKFNLVLKGKTAPLTFTQSGTTYTYDPNGTITEIAPTGSDASATILGLDNVDYTLIETVVPNGYTKAADKDVSGLTEASVDVDITTATVENKKGTVLPSTGGIGTTIFYIVGSLLVIGCGIVLVSRRRMNNK